MANDLSNRTALITGGNRGIGLETARELGRQGIDVVIGARDLKKGAAAADLLRAEGIKAAAIRFDAQDPATFQAAYDYFDKSYGRLDILVNNAGVLNEALLGGGSTATVSGETLKDTFETNFFAVVALTQKLLPLIRKAPAGRIVNLSSILGSLTLHSQPDSPIAFAKAFAYNASKTALNAFTVHLAYELRETNIKVNSAHPGWVKTDLGGSAAPEEVEGSGRTSAQLATLPNDGRTGGFVHLNDTLPW